VAETPTLTLRLPADLRDDAELLALSVGSRAAAIVECVREWTRAVTAAQKDNATLFARHEWNMLADTCNGIGTIPEIVPDDGTPFHPEDERYLWGSHIAMELHDAHALDHLGVKWFPESWGRKKITARVAEMCRQLELLDALHGYALMDALRLFWSDAGVTRIDHTEDEWWTTAFRAELATRAQDAADAVAT